ncbi:MAG: T9SS type A sorting domain-containing protein [Bacteroidetes bacterium]|nr:T9SS type A sorting domain-containing protein [Bacteroidota bacterium]
MKHFTTLTLLITLLVSAMSLDLAAMRILERHVEAHFVIKLPGDKFSTSIKVEGPSIILVLPTRGKICTEMVSMCLRGITNNGNSVEVRIGSAFGLPPSKGEITSISPRRDFPAISSFDVFIEIELGDGSLLRNPDPITVRDVVHDADFNDISFHLETAGCMCILDDGDLHGLHGSIELTVIQCNNVDCDKTSNLEESNLDLNPNPVTSYPNPFTNSTLISIHSDEIMEASLVVYDISGKQVAMLFEGVLQEGETKRLKFDASAFPDGVYFYKYTKANGESHYDKLIKSR